MREPSVRDQSSKPVDGSAGFPIGGGSPVAEPGNPSSHRAGKLGRVMRVARSWFAGLISSPSIRFLTFFFIGTAAASAWQSYRDAGAETITNWCGRWVPQAGPAAQNVSARSEDLVPVAPDILRMTSLNLAAVRESIDKVAAELSRLQTIEKLAAELTRLQVIERAAPDRASAPSPLVPPIPPAGKPPTPSRPSPAH
jgi:hypothetical protein